MVVLPVSLAYLFKVTLSILPVLLCHLKSNLYKYLFYFLQCLQSKCILHDFWFP